MTTEVTRKQLLVGKGWIQAVALVVLLGFGVLGLLAYRTYTADPPIAAAPSARTARCCSPAPTYQGQQVFLRAGLMEYGSIFGHGAYLGPDFTADYLHRAAELAVASHRGSDQARQQVITDFQANRYDPGQPPTVRSAATAPSADRIGPRDDPRDTLGLDSLDFLAVVTRVSERTGIRIDEDDYDGPADLDGWVALLTTRTPRPRRSFGPLQRDLAPCVRRLAPGILGLTGSGRPEPAPTSTVAPSTAEKPAIGRAPGSPDRPVTVELAICRWGADRWPPAGVVAKAVATPATQLTHWIIMRTDPAANA